MNMNGPQQKGNRSCEASCRRCLVSGREKQDRAYTNYNTGTGGDSNTAIPSPVRKNGIRPIFDPFFRPVFDPFSIISDPFSSRFRAAFGPVSDRFPTVFGPFWDRKKSGKSIEKR